MSPQLVKARWYETRRAQNRKPVTYTCPFCPRKLPAFSEHVLIRPEGQGEGRRHAHIACAARARAAGRLPTRAEWRATQPRRRGRLARLLARLRGRR
ncbi:MAG: hypothetical protein QOF26_3727 [Baekduia sp.]|jgi:hypothetical protein|nr:hypothetical protein [Baekduia sp.]